MVEKIEPMDILRIPTSDDLVLAQIGEWFKVAYPNNAGTKTVVFKRNTPTKILNLFVNSTQLFPKIAGYEVSSKYEIEK